MSKKFSWTELNPVYFHRKPSLSHQAFDAIIIHYTVNPIFPTYLSDDWRNWIAAFRGPKFTFLQDEYQHVQLQESEQLSLGTTVLFTLADLSKTPALYPRLSAKGVRFVKVLPGYSSLRPLDLDSQLATWSERTVDIFYRSRLVPAYLGTHGYLKKRLVDEFAMHATAGLTFDLSVDEGERLYGSAWRKALLRSKATLGCEGGSSIWDYSGEAKRTVDSLVTDGIVNHKTLLQSVSSFEERGVYATSSPRIFESASHCNLAIYVEGAYDGILEPWVHYFPLKSDFSNIQEAIEFLGAPDALRMIEVAYRDLIDSERFSYSQLSSTVERTLLSELGAAAEKRLDRVGAEINSSSLNSELLSLRSDFVFLLELHVSKIFPRWALFVHYFLSRGRAVPRVLVSRLIRLGKKLLRSSQTRKD